ncbi:MAG: tRNA preQ1(34) S-adenosylmethionine ribosyltransferase-isomerase QueA [Brevinematia bacterium]
MRLEDLYFELPEELIAEKPAEKREESRLLVVLRGENRFYETKFREITDLFKKGELLVFNNTKVFKARLLGKTEGGRNVDLLLVERVQGNLWKAMVKNSRKFKSGTSVCFRNVVAKIGERVEEFRLIRFDKNLDFDDIDKIGVVPLPPYIIKRRKSLGLEEYTDEDDERYQSVLAKVSGSVAAPTASFHFSEELLSRLRESGVNFAFVTLHIGPGTFKPVEGDIDNFKIHREWIEVDSDNIELIKKAKMEKNKITAIGTTSVRTLETIASIFGDVRNFKAYSGYTDLFIKEGYRFKLVDGMVTNFHLPYSTLLLLVYAFAGKELIQSAYRYAIENKFRFFSYGDAMIIR